jgi:hypothetical protein
MDNETGHASFYHHIEQLIAQEMQKLAAVFQQQSSRLAEYDFIQIAFTVAQYCFQARRPLSLPVLQSHELGSQDIA